MLLGIIGWIDEASFQKARERSLDFIELCVNDRDVEFLENLEQTKGFSKQYEMPIASVGRWGQSKIAQDGSVIEAELVIDCKLIEAAKDLKSPVYVTGCNYVETLSYEENVSAAIKYFEKLLSHGAKHGVKIATCNCRWNNFICDDQAYSAIHSQLPTLGIKYDTSHCIYAGGDYLSETKKWGDRFVHIHIKGALVIDGQRYDDPPAGLDQTDWPSFMAVLYAKKYEGGLSIEPHSENWNGVPGVRSTNPQLLGNGSLGEKGIDFTIKYMRNLIL